MTEAETKPLSDSGRLDWLRLIRSENVGPVVFRQLLERYGSPAAALQALPELARRAGARRGIRLCGPRSEEHTSELQSLMRISYAVFCLKNKKHKHSK